MLKLTTEIAMTTIKETAKMARLAWDKTRQSQLAQTTKLAVGAVADKSKDIADKVSETLINQEELARYGGFKPKEIREAERKRRQRIKEKSELANPFKTEKKRVEADPE
jgi:predicted DNA-binding helix-hairpin-helix protein